MSKNEPMTKQKKAVKGAPGYLNLAKRNKLLWVIGITAVMFVLLVISNFLGEKSGAFLKVAAILLVLPGSNFLVHFVAMFPYHSRDPKEFERLLEIAPHCDVMTELAITNPNGPTCSLPYAVTGKDKLTIYFERTGKPDTVKKLPSNQKLGSYLEGRLRLSELDFPVEVTDNLDTFEKRVQALAPLGEEDLEYAARVRSALLANSF